VARPCEDARPSRYQTASNTRIDDEDESPRPTFDAPLVTELKSDDRGKGAATWGRRQFRDLLTRFFDRFIDDRVARTVYDLEFRYRSIRLDLETHIDHKSGTGGNLTMWLVPGALKPIFNDFSVKTDIGFAIAGCSPVFMSLAVPGSLFILVGLSATAPFPMLFLRVRTVFRLFGAFVRTF
jgi:hypothetical protein